MKLLVKNHNQIIITVEGMNKKILNENNNKKDIDINNKFSHKISFNCSKLYQCEYKYELVEIPLINKKIINRFNIFLFFIF
jgi:hypothetical protein